MNIFDSNAQQHYHPLTNDNEPIMKKELQNLYKRVIGDETENASDHLVFPFFQKIFGNIKKQSEAKGADIYIDGRLVVELKTKNSDWLIGFFQALHYKKKGLSFSAITVISNHFIGLWKIANLPEEAITIADASDPATAPNEIGKINARECNKGLESEILKKSSFLFNFEIIRMYPNSIEEQLFEYQNQLENLDNIRCQVNTGNFLKAIGALKPFFPDPLQAIHCFYTIAPYWDITSTVPEAHPSSPDKLFILGKNGKKMSDPIIIAPNHHQDFAKYVESHYLFTNDNEGLTVDYYFSRFDEALAEHDPDYVKQHGIFFTDINLSRFAYWFIREKFGEKKLSDKYIVIDPAGGSGNLVSSWKRNHLKFKIVSELNPDLLKTIELRLKNDPVQVEQGYNIVPKTHENKGLNFIDKPASEYYGIIEKYLGDEGKSIDKPFAFLLNPPYKNTDENKKEREDTEANYGIDKSLLKITGNDAGKERYLAFLAQILELCKLQKTNNPTTEPVLMIFTPTSWLIPRPTYQEFRQKFDEHFKFEKGFMVNGQEFFKIAGRWPVAFTIWRYNQKQNKNKIRLWDLTEINRNALATIDWNKKFKTLNKEIAQIVKGKKEILFDQSRGSIRYSLPLIDGQNKQQMYDFKRSPTDSEKTGSSIYGGLPLKDSRRKNAKTYGANNGKFIGFMDDNTPVRINQDKYKRMSLKPDRVWFRLDNDLKSCNKTRITSGPTDKYSYCAYDLETGKVLCSWFGISKAISDCYPVWANQFDFWQPSIAKKFESEYYSLCFAFALAENRCVVTKFEKDNPAQNTTEIFVDNPLCPINPDSFWSMTLDSQINGQLAKQLVDKIKGLYKHWNIAYCKGQNLQNVGLKNEPYFKDFAYPDFVTPYSGLIQIRKYAEINNKADLLEICEDVKKVTKQVRSSLCSLIVNNFKYFK